MNYRFFCIIAAVVVLPLVAAAQKTAGHPDLSGIWTYGIDLPPTALKKEINGTVSVKGIDRSASAPARTPIPGALPST